MADISLDGDIPEFDLTVAAKAFFDPKKFIEDHEGAIAPHIDTIKNIYLRGADLKNAVQTVGSVKLTIGASVLIIYSGNLQKFPKNSEAMKDPDSWTYRRLSAVCAFIATMKKVDLINPLAEAAGFSKEAADAWPDDNVKALLQRCYLLYTPGLEYLFWSYPLEVVALLACRVANYEALGLKQKIPGWTTADLAVTVTRQRANDGTMFIDFIDNPLNKASIERVLGLVMQCQPKGKKAIIMRADEVVHRLQQLIRDLPVIGASARTTYQAFGGPGGNAPASHGSRIGANLSGLSGAGLGGGLLGGFGLSGTYTKSGKDASSQQNISSDSEDGGEGTRRQPEVNSKGMPVDSSGRSYKLNEDQKMLLAKMADRLPQDAFFLHLQKDKVPSSSLKSMSTDDFIKLVEPYLNGI